MMSGSSETMKSTAMLLFYGCGIVGMLAMYGVIQERVMTQSYGGEMFSYSMFLVLCNRLAAVTFAIVMACWKKESLKNKAPLWCYLVISVSNVIASTCQYEALKHVSFVVQMLGKSFKMMPVMLWSMAVSGKRYGLQDWLVASGVTFGITLFLVSGPTEANNTNSSTASGLLFMLGFLGFDGLTSVVEEKLFKEYQTSKWNQILYVNMLSSVTSSFGLVSMGGLLPSLAFAAHHPAFVTDVSMLSASAVGGQYFIYSQIREFGALIFALTMNVRQVVSICLSYTTYNHSITTLQIAGILMIFVALFGKSYASLAKPAKKEEEPLLEKRQADPEVAKA